VEAREEVLLCIYCFPEFFLTVLFCLVFTEEPEIDLDVALRTSIVAKAGEDVQIMIPFKGRPAPSVTWRKGEKNISSDPRYNIQNTESSTLVDIPQVTRNDTGKYVLTIENGVLDTPSESWAAVTTKCSNTSFKITGLSEKTSFFFRVLAENENGLGEPAETAEPVKASEVPGPIRDLTMKDSTKTSVTLSWSKPDYDGGSIVTEYIIESKLKDTQEWSHASISKVCENEVTKLKELSVVEFRVAAKNEKGLSDWVHTAPITVKDYVITPEADISEIVGGQITVRIGHNVHIELPYKGKPRPTISWLKDNIPLKESEQVRFKKTESKLSLNIKNVKKENGGKYTLILDNLVSRKSYAITVITLGPPSKPKGPVRFDEIKADSIIMSWDAPEDNGGGEITSYSIEKRETSQTNWKMVCSSVARTTFKIPNLVKGTEYQFRVKAENRYGVSPPLNSVDVIAKHQFRPPGPPGKPVVYNITSDGMTISWDAPIYDGGSEITGFHPDHDGGSRISSYLIEMKQKGSDHWIEAGQTKLLTLTINNLTENTEYEFRVRAKNDAGYSEPREAFSSVIIKEPQIEPTADLSGITRQHITCKAGNNFTIDIPISGRPVDVYCLFRI
uniref:Titin n=1 Tax=Xenopus tropicalis TaxID=8364 RepID=A0A6I8QI94_XENTR